MRYFEIFENRSKEISMNDVDLSSIQIALNNPSKIYRGIKTDNPILFVDPTQHVRKSKNTRNYYTLLMDNLPSWSSYPKRSKSIICSAYKSQANAYGNDIVYHVLPIGNPKIGIAPNLDIWMSFNYMRKVFFNLPQFNDVLKKLYFHYFKEVLNDDNYNVFMSQLKQLENTPFPDYDEYLHQAKQMRDNPGFIMKSWLFNNDDDDALEKLYTPKFTVNEIIDLMDPVKNNFQLTDMKNFNIVNNQEVWLSAPCYLINDKYWNKFLERL